MSPGDDEEKKRLVLGNDTPYGELDILAQKLHQVKNLEDISHELSKLGLCKRDWGQGVGERIEGTMSASCPRAGPPGKRGSVRGL